MRHWQKIVAALILTSLTACVSSKSFQQGIQSDYLAHIPARISVLSCRLWPQGARFFEQAQTEVPAQEVQSLCDEIDRFVLNSFDGQPFMRGLSPKVVTALLERNQQPAMLSQIDQLWFRPGQVCQGCRQPAAYYNEVVAPRADWRAWLSQFSRATTSSDAILMPLLTFVSSRRVDDRGLFYAERRASLVLFLIDSNNGQLMWTQQRDAEVRLPLADAKVEPKPEQFPTWDELWKRLLVEDLWLQFPGRQT